MAAYFCASPIDVEVKLDGEDERKQMDMKAEKERVITCPVYYDGDSLAGQVCNCTMQHTNKPIIFDYAR